MRPVVPISALLGSVPVAVAVFWVSFSYFQTDELNKAQGRLSLFEETVTAELERFSHLTYILARDSFVLETAKGGTTKLLNIRLAAFARQAGLDAIYLMRSDGLTVAASNANDPGSFVGQNYAFRPYFQDAAEGRQGRFYGIGATTGLPGYFIADPVLDEHARVLGVIALKLGLTNLETVWRESGETVFLANKDGVVLLASNPDWRYHLLSPLSPEQQTRIRASRQFPGQALDLLDWHPTGPHGALIAGKGRIHLTAANLPHGWTLHYFARDDRAWTRAWLVTGGLAILAALMFIATQMRRTRQIGQALRRSEAEETQLRAANERLAVEIEDRRTAERRLRRTQGELERASRLAALGELAASVTHELGQPIAAMRNHLAVAEMSDAAPAVTGVLPRLSGLVDRMEGITRQLKFFAGTKAEDFAPVDLGSAMDASVALVQPNLSEAAATLTWVRPKRPVTVRASQLRLEQVMTNILRNAIDAVEDCDQRDVSVVMGETNLVGWFEVRDTGPGIGASSLADIQEPFVTSRESGRGMGLGLAISANIVKEHHGQISARNRAGGGAVFRVEIPLEEAESGSDE